MINGTVSLTGRLKYAPPVPTTDTSSNPTWLSDLREQMACSARKEEEFLLAADGDTAVNFGSLTNGANWVVVKVTPNVGTSPTPAFPNGVPAAQNPVVVKLTSPAGTTQAVEVDGFMILASQNVAYTAMSIARTVGIPTTVRVQLFAFGS